jgi:hypothetical protein
MLTTRRLLAAAALTLGVAAGTAAPANAATVATVSNGALSVIGDNAANTVTVSRNGAGTCSSTAAPSRSPAARRRWPTSR